MLVPEAALRVRATLLVVLVSVQAQLAVLTSTWILSTTTSCPHERT